MILQFRILDWRTGTWAMTEFGAAARLAIIIGYRFDIVEELPDV